MSWAKWTVAAACLVSAGSSGSSSGKDSSTTTAVSNKAGTVAATAWKDVAQGKFGRKPWKVASAKSSTGYRCYDAQGSAQPAPGDTSTGSPTRAGRATYCLPPASETGSPQFVALV